MAVSGGRKSTSTGSGSPPPPISTHRPPDFMNSPKRQRSLSPPLIDPSHGPTAQVHLLPGFRNSPQKADKTRVDADDEFRRSREATDFNFAVFEEQEQRGVGNIEEKKLVAFSFSREGTKEDSENNNGDDDGNKKKKKKVGVLDLFGDDDEEKSMSERKAFLPPPQTSTENGEEEVKKEKRRRKEVVPVALVTRIIYNTIARTLILKI